MSADPGRPSKQKTYGVKDLVMLAELQTPGVRTPGSVEAV